MTSIEAIFRKQVEQLDEIKCATVLLGHKDDLVEQLCQAKLEMETVLKAVDVMRQDLETMRAGNVEYRNLSQLLKKLDAKIVSMEKFLPDDFIQGFNQLGQTASPCVASSKSQRDLDDSRNGDISRITEQVEGMGVDTPELRMEDCKKTLFKKVEDSYTMDLLNEEEFSRIPKYMIGRQSLTTLNDFVKVINQILDGKYSLLALGKNGARKKGKLDLYLSLKREEIVVTSGEDPIYFFTAEDYLRHTQTKLDKTKLNLLTVLRHCKRLKELRSGKALHYVLVRS